MPMDVSQIAALLQPYLAGLTLPPGIYGQLDTYLDLLLRWNAKINLTAIREPEAIVTRHFGESLFTAGALFGDRGCPTPGAPSNPSFGLGGLEDAQSNPGAPSNPSLGLGGIRDAQSTCTTLADLGSGAGFPGLPIKLAFAELHVTLIESQNKKATFLREVIRALGLQHVEVYNGRAEHWGRQADVVTLRAVEKFERILPAAAELVAPRGRLCLLVGGSFDPSTLHLAAMDWQAPINLPASEGRKLLVGRRAE